MRRIIQGHDGPVEIDETRQTVTKTYLHRDREIAVRMAGREVSYASRFSAALAQAHGIACPRILASDLSPPPRVVMALCPGEPLSRFLKRVRDQDPRIAKIAGKIHDGLDLYTRLFDEPYYDLSFQNMLYDEATGILTFVDFCPPSHLDEQSRGPPLEMSLGNFVGWACYDMSRPACLFALKLGYLEVLSAVLAAFEGQVSKRRVCVLAHAAFFRLTRSGPVIRRNYYKTAGTVMAGRYLDRLKLSPTFSDVAEPADNCDADNGGPR